MKKFKLLTASGLNGAVAGTVVYEYPMYDYGLASDDTRYTGIEHISLTLDAEGKPPSFTHPKHELEEIK